MLKCFQWKDEFFRHTGLTTLGVGLFNFFNFLYHFFMVRVLPPVEYGHLNTIMAAFMMISVPASTVQTTVTKFVSSYHAQRQYDLVKNLLRHLMVLTSLVGSIIFLVLLLSSNYLASFLQISPRELMILLGVMLFFGMVIPVPWGGLQGLQQFGLLTFNLTINGALKFLLGIGFILLGVGVLGAVSAICLSYVITTFLSLLMLKSSLLKGEASASGSCPLPPSHVFSPSEIHQYFLPTGITLLCFMVLTNIDLILVKHFFKPTEAGYYSIAQMLGKIILFLPIPVVMVMFPKLNTLAGQREEMISILNRSLGFALIFCSLAILIGFLFPHTILQILSGKVYPDCIPLIRLFCVNMTLYSLILILLYYHLSLHRRGFLYPLVFFTMAQIGLIILFHQSLTQVLMLVGIVAFCLFLINVYLIYRFDGR